MPCFRGDTKDMRALVFLNGEKAHSRLTIETPLIPQSPSSYYFIDHPYESSFPIEDSVWIGDGDSSSPDVSFSKKILLDQEKNFSDFGACLDLLSKDPLYVLIQGGFGKRKDHELINLEEARFFLKKRTSPTVLFFEPYLILSNTELILHLEKNQLFSMVSESTIECSGALYDGKLNLTRPSHGLSNQSLGSPISFKPFGIFEIIVS